MSITNTWTNATVAALLACSSFASAHAQQCQIQSTAQRVTVVELYTSEGCNSCPPADRWFSGLAQQGVSPDKAILLAYHVDYWNQLGWTDRFSRASFSARQRDVASRASRGVVYTPQIVLDGRDLRHGYNVEQLRGKLADINHQKGQAKIQATVSRSGNDVGVSGEVQMLDPKMSKGAWVWIAAFENGLSSPVNAGENAGKRLYHDYVVRDLAGPFLIGADGRAQLNQHITLPADANAARTGIAIFIERSDTGEVLEATSQYPLCPA
ncbi:MAG: DUF1223 domain-containing protein [Betaproteobacteria bacterium]